MILAVQKLMLQWRTLVCNDKRYKSHHDWCVYYILDTLLEIFLTFNPHDTHARHAFFPHLTGEETEAY